MCVLFRGVLIIDHNKHYYMEAYKKNMYKNLTKCDFEI